MEPGVPPVVLAAAPVAFTVLEAPPLPLVLPEPALVTAVAVAQPVVAAAPAPRLRRTFAPCSKRR